MRLPSEKKAWYPDELTCRQIDRYKSFSVFEDQKKAGDYAEKTDGCIYTLVDCDGKMVYARGIHYVNRTGRYAVVKS
jgi:hypothetical protein